MEQQELEPPNHGNPSETGGQMPFTFNQVGVSEVKKAILAMRSTGSCGVDGVPITILKQGLPALALPLTHLTNKVIESSVWPA